MTDEINVHTEIDLTTGSQIFTVRMTAAEMQRLMYGIEDNADIHDCDDPFYNFYGAVCNETYDDRTERRLEKQRKGYAVVRRAAELASQLPPTPSGDIY